jgi:hypothetical protein
MEIRQMRGARANLNVGCDREPATDRVHASAAASEGGSASLHSKAEPGVEPYVATEALPSLLSPTGTVVARPAVTEFFSGCSNPKLRQFGGREGPSEVNESSRVTRSRVA